jgi:hypothetical protein
VTHTALWLLAGVTVAAGVVAAVVALAFHLGWPLIVGAFALTAGVFYIVAGLALRRAQPPSPEPEPPPARPTQAEYSGPYGVRAGDDSKVNLDGVKSWGAPLLSACDHAEVNVKDSASYIPSLPPLEQPPPSKPTAPASTPPPGSGNIGWKLRGVKGVRWRGGGFSGPGTAIDAEDSSDLEATDFNIDTRDASTSPPRPVPPPSSPGMPNRKARRAKKSGKKGKGRGQK